MCWCLNCSFITLCPKAFQPRVERMFSICLCDTDMSHRKQDVCHWTFLSPWQPCLPMLPCLLLTVLLFPFKVWRTWWWATKVWALLLFHSAFSVFLFCSCFQTIAAKYGRMLGSDVAANEIHSFCSPYFSMVISALVCWFDVGLLLWLVSLHPLHYNICKQIRVRTVAETFALLISVCGKSVYSRGAPRAARS